MKRISANLLIFCALSMLIGVALTVLQVVGIFRQLDAACLGLASSPPHDTFNPLDGITVIFLFAVLPGIGIILWRAQTTILCTAGGLFAYYGIAYLYLRHFGHMVGVVTPTIAAVLSLLRGFGYHPNVDVEWAKKHGSFISYRREDGADVARLICSELGRRGLPTFLDVEGLRASHFDDQLLRRIDDNPNFIVILTPGALDRCLDDNDWLRKEVSYAIAKNKNVVPIMMPGFTFPVPDTMHKTISDLPRYQAVMYSHNFFSVTIDKLVEFLKENRRGLRGMG